MNSANLTRGAVLSGTVASVDDFYARVQLDGQLGIAYVHISQFSDGSLSPPMAAYLSVGDRLTGVVAHLSGRFGCPELSPKLLRRSGAGKSPVVSKEVEECEITKANELYTLTRTPNGPGLLTNHLGSWSRYEVLLTSGLLTEGQSLALIRTGQCDESGRWKMRFPIFPVARHDRANVTLKGEIILWRPNATRKKDQMLRNILYVHTGSGFVLRIECNDLLDITEHFSIGETIDVSLVDQPPFREIPFGTVARTETDLQRPARELQVGKKVTGKVVRLLPGGAIVLVADHCPVFLPAASVMPGKEFVGAALQCGDMLEGLVSVVNDPSAEGDKGSSVKGVMSFSRLVQPSTVSRQTRSPLIDVSAERKAAVRGGFGRDATFRFEVLQANEYTCCFCGQNFSVEKATAMEAAHIVPRAKRGTDHISNGLCLCPVHHWAFDRGLWAIDDSRVIRIAAAVRRQRTSIAAWLCEFHGKSATFPVRTVVSFEAIDWHRRNVFLDADDSDDVKLQ